MNYTQNQKIEQVTESTLVLGVDIGSSEHYVRAFDYQGRELTRKVFRFSTDINGFNSFYDWVTQICIKHGSGRNYLFYRGSSRRNGWPCGLRRTPCEPE